MMKSELKAMTTGDYIWKIVKVIFWLIVGFLSAHWMGSDFWLVRLILVPVGVFAMYHFNVLVSELNALAKSNKSQQAKSDDELADRPHKIN